MNTEQRRAATDQHHKAIESINDLFDRLDDPAAARDRLTGIEPLDDVADPVRDAESVLEHAERLRHALDQLRSAALAAADHRRRTDLAADVGTTSAALFPRPPSRPTDPARPTPAPSTSTTDSGAPRREAS